MSINMIHSSGPVQTHAVRTVPVRGTAGDTDTCRFAEYAQGDISEYYIHVPEVDMTAITAGTSDLNYIRRIGAFRAANAVLGVVSDFYLISPSFISDTVVEGLVTAGAAIYGGHREDFISESCGQVHNTVTYKVAGCVCSPVASMNVDKAYATYNGHPVMRLDPSCCVFA